MSATTTTKTNALAMLGKKRKSDAENDDYAPTSTAKKPRTKSISGPKVGTCGMTKKDLGDAIKIEKYGAQRTMVSTTMDDAFFRAFFDTGIAGVKISPADYDASTPVVTAHFGNRAAGELFGVSKVKGGNRYTENHVSAVMAVLYPPQQKFVMFFSI
ncbi:hypothetical protein EXIGLDRAFT_618133 [Exidia glandulosa HHB12029]|uniref:Uncharacterized protein n=1 Tax=Exidia glandulosa HHB12029 TaxID=1314781 RepID=A0A165FTA8_EXIGL|nr:hypothetical protein EXIGLDRAFT_618133 [Exidia glandulosa HHB12029]